MIKSFQRLAAAALLLTIQLSPVLAGQGKTGGAPEKTTFNVPSLGSGALSPMGGLQELTTIKALDVQTVPTLPNVVPMSVTAQNVNARSANAVNPNAAQVQPATLDAAQPVALDASAPVSVQSVVAQQNPKNIPLITRAQNIALSLFSFMRPEQKPQEGSLVYAPAKNTASIGSRLKRSTRNLAVAAMLAFGVLGNSQIALAQNAPAEIAAHQQAQSSEVLRVSSVQEMIQKWDPAKHVIVIGDLPAPAAGMIDDIKKDLKGSHVYVLFVADASGLHYVDDGNNRRSGNAAAEFGLGQGVGGKAEYHALKDPRTGESDGVIFLVSWAPDRYMAYGPSKTQLDAGLTIQSFQQNIMGTIGNNLRQPTLGIREAVKTLRTWVDENVSTSIENRERNAKTAIADAKSELASMQSEAADFNKRHPNTAITTPGVAGLRARIEKAESLFAQKRFSEAGAEASAAAQSARAGRDALSGFDGSYRSAKDELRSASAQIDALESATVRFKAKHPKADGDMSRPDLSGMRKTLSSYEGKLDANPASVAQGAAAVKAQVKTALDALAVFENDGQSISDVQKAIDANAKQQRADAGAVERQAAQTALNDAKEAYERGNTAYSRSLSEARTKVAQADARVAEADAAAAAKRFWTIFGLLAALGTFLGWLTWLALRARPTTRKAREVYAEKKALVDGKLEAVFGATPEQELGNFDAKVETFVGAADGPNKKDLKGRTAELADQVRLDAAAMNIIWPAMGKVLELAAALIFPKGLNKLVYFFRKQPFEKGLKMLKDEPVTFTPNDGIPQLFGKKKDWREDLYGTVSSQAAFTKTFEELVAEYNTRAKRAADALTLIEHKTFALEPTVQAIEGAAKEAAAFQAELNKSGAADGLFLLAPLFATLLPAAAKSLKKLQADHRQDPVGAIDGSGMDSKRMAEEAKALAKWVEATRAGQVTAAYAAKKTLADAGFETAWIDKALADLSKRADAAAEKAVERSIAPELTSLAERSKALAAQIASAVALAKRLAELRASIDAQTNDVAAARAQAAAATGADADKTLREKGKDPTKTLAAATRSGEAAEEAISTGKIEAAEAALAEGEKALATAKGVVAEARAALAAQATDVAARLAESKRLNALKPQREKILQDIKKRFAKTVLDLRAGDPAHPSANGTIDDNVDETTEHLASADAKREEAVAAFAAGNVLDAADLLRQSNGHLAIAQHRLDEISEKLARLEAAVLANGVKLASLQKEVASRKTMISDDARSQEPTREAVRALRSLLATAEEAVGETKGDPFAAETKLAKVAADLAQVDVSFKNDVDQYNEAIRSLKSADAALLSAANAASTAKNDGHGDSQAILSAYNALERLRDAYNKAKLDAGAQHGQWSKVDVEADRITNEAAKVTAVLRQEIEAAEEASAKISNAASKVREATNWTGRYGVYIPGSPGSDDLSRARSALSSGNYADAKRYAAEAHREAANAISRAEAEVDRLYREEQRRLEEERRRRQQEEDDRREAARRAEESRRSSSGSGGGGFGGSSSGMGGGSW